MLDDFGSPGTINRRILGSPRPQSIHLAIAHAENSRDQHGVVDFEIRCAVLVRRGNVFRGHVFPALLDSSRDVEQRLHLRGDLRALPVCFHTLNQRLDLPSPRPWSFQAPYCTFRAAKIEQVGRLRTLRDLRGVFVFAALMFLWWPPISVLCCPAGVALPD
jgi:hypothetical protein